MKQKITTVFWSIIAILAVSAVNFAQTQPARQTDDEIIKVETTLVSVPVIVSDRNGRYISNLKAKDFTLYQNGVKQNIDFFAPTEEPLNVALLIDTSRSTVPVLDDIKDAAISFIEQLQPRDRATIVSFDYEPHVLTPQLTSNKQELIRAVEYAEIGEYVGTTLRDAVMETINRTFSNVKGRKAIILLTDGKDARSQTTIEELRRSTEESDTLIYSVFYQTGGGFNRNNRRNNRQNSRFPQRQNDIYDDRFPDEDRLPDERRNRRFPNNGRINERFPDDDDFGGGFPNRRRPQRMARAGQKNAEAEDFLQALADSTAGRFYRSEVENLNETFNSIIGELRFQYRLGFYPPENTTVSNDAAQEIRVQVACPNAVVRARRNYRVER